MSKLYQKRNLVTNQNVGQPGPLPPELAGLSDQDLENLSWAADSLGYAGFGFFPVVVYDFEQDRTARIAAIVAKHALSYAQGFNIVIEGQTENLQMRPSDLVNWLVFKNACDDAIAAGFGSYEAETPIRCTSNNEYLTTNEQGRAVMIALRSYGAALMKAKWRIDKAYTQAASKAELDAVDLSWPSNNGWVVS